MSEKAVFEPLKYENTMPLFVLYDIKVGFGQKNYTLKHYFALLE